jgi:Kef-type K+ transport system membrane component KefB
MTSPEATVILGAAVIDDVMGMFVLAILAASATTGSSDNPALAPMLTAWLSKRSPMLASHLLLVQLAAISVCVALFFAVGYGSAKRWLDPLILQLRKLPVNEAIPSCIFALVLLYAVSAEVFGSVAGITGAYLLGFVFASSPYKGDIERSFYAIGHGLLIPLFFVSMGLSSDYHALSGHWGLMFLTLVVAVAGKLVGCGSAALTCGMDWVRSLRVGFGMISRGEVGLIVTAMGASTGIFRPTEVAVMVAVVLLTTLVTPMALRGAFALRSGQDVAEGLVGLPHKSHSTEAPPAAEADTLDLPE